MTEALREAEVDALLQDVRAYLLSPNLGGEEWPVIPAEQLEQGSALMLRLASLKWGMDSAGHRPVSLLLLNRANNRLIWDIPVQNEGAFTGPDLMRVQLENLAVCSKAMRAYSEKVAHLSVALENERRSIPQAVIDLMSG